MRPRWKKSGKVAGAVHVSRGMLEFRADPETPYHDKNFAKDKIVPPIVRPGGRSAFSVERCSRIWAIGKSITSVPLRIGPKTVARSTIELACENPADYARRNSGLTDNARYWH